MWSYPIYGMCVGGVSFSFDSVESDMFALCTLVALIRVVHFFDMLLTIKLRKCHISTNHTF